MINKKKGEELIIVIPDLHIPYHDRKAVRKVNRFLKENAKKIDKIIFLGDLVDFYSISRYDKNPQRILGLGNELRQARNYLKNLRSFFKGEIVLVEGNHEARLEKYLWNHPELEGFEFTMINLLSLEELEVSYYKDYYYKGWLFTHGTFVGKYAASRELASNDCNGFSGHTHRVMVVSKTTREGTKWWFNIGHLADVDLIDYGRNFDWQQAIGYLIIGKDYSKPGIILVRDL